MVAAKPRIGEWHKYCKRCHAAGQQKLRKSFRQRGRAFAFFRNKYQFLSGEPRSVDDAQYLRLEFLADRCMPTRNQCLRPKSLLA